MINVTCEEVKNEVFYGGNSTTITLRDNEKVELKFSNSVCLEFCPRLYISHEFILSLLTCRFQLKEVMVSQQVVVERQKLKVQLW